MQTMGPGELPFTTYCFSARGNNCLQYMWVDSASTRTRPLQHSTRTPKSGSKVEGGIVYGRPRVVGCQGRRPVSVGQPDDRKAIQKKKEKHQARVAPGIATCPIIDVTSQTHDCINRVSPARSGKQLAKSIRASCLAGWLAGGCPSSGDPPTQSLSCSLAIQRRDSPSQSWL